MSHRGSKNKFAFLISLFFEYSTKTKLFSHGNVWCFRLNDIKRFIWRALEIYWHFQCKVNNKITTKEWFVSWIKIIDIAELFLVFSPFLLLKRYLIKLIGLLGPVRSLLENVIETFNGPWGFWDALIEYLQDVEFQQNVVIFLDSL